MESKKLCSYLNHKYHKHPILLKDLISDSHEEKFSDKIKHGKGRKKHRCGGEGVRGRREITYNKEKRSIQKISPLSLNTKHRKNKQQEHKSKHYLNMPAQLRGELFFFYVFHSCFASEQVNCHPGGKQALVLLPLQCL